LLLQRNFSAKAAKHVLLIEKAHHGTIKHNAQYLSYPVVIHEIRTSFDRV